MKPISPEEFEAKIWRIIEESKKEGNLCDIEARHIVLDDLLCETLASLGYEKGIELFNNVSKWYA